MMFQFCNRVELCRRNGVEDSTSVDNHIFIKLTIYNMNVNTISTQSWMRQFSFSLLCYDFLVSIRFCRMLIHSEPLICGACCGSIEIETSLVKKSCKNIPASIVMRSIFNLPHILQNNDETTWNAD